MSLVSKHNLVLVYQPGPLFSVSDALGLADPGGTVPPKSTQFFDIACLPVYFSNANQPIQSPYFNCLLYGALTL